MHDETNVENADEVNVAAEGSDAEVPAEAQAAEVEETEVQETEVVEDEQTKQ